MGVSCGAQVIVLLLGGFTIAAALSKHYIAKVFTFTPSHDAVLFSCLLSPPVCDKPEEELSSTGLHSQQRKGSRYYNFYSVLV